MINLLYSILVSGCNTIPEHHPRWRKYVPMGYVGDPVLLSIDPHEKASYACAVISLASGSNLYHEILELDPHNTYCIPPSDGDAEYISTMPYHLELSYSDILKESRHVPKDIRDRVNPDNPCDVAALLSISVLKRDRGV